MRLFESVVLTSLSRSNCKLICIVSVSDGQSSCISRKDTPLSWRLTGAIRDAGDLRYGHASWTEQYPPCYTFCCSCGILEMSMGVWHSRLRRRLSPCIQIVDVYLLRFSRVYLRLFSGGNIRGTCTVSNPQNN